MTWRTAQSLVVLRNEVNLYAPSRLRTYDGTIGDEAHQQRPSAHNPNDAGDVCAWDVTHSPPTGFDAHAWARKQTTRPPKALCYIISNGQVARWSNGWKWVAYKGANPHKTHAHVVVGRGSDSEPTNAALYNDCSSWRVAELMEDDMNEAEVIALIDRRIAEKTDIVWSDDVKAAQDHLVKLRIVSGARDPRSPASWGIVALGLSRALKLMGR